jgi:hypothetical protein
MTRARKASTIPSAIVLLLALVSLGFSRDVSVPGDFTRLELALEKASPGDRILLGPGLYNVNNLTMVESVAIIGNIDDPGSVVLNGQGRGCVLRVESLQEAYLSGLTITGGTASGSDPYSSSGGALLISHATVRVDHVHFIANQAQTSGGAVRICRGSIYATDCLFQNNLAFKGGGAIDLSYGSYAHLERATFLENTAAWGGAVSTRYTSLLIATDSHFLNNNTIAPQEFGGALFSDRSASLSLTGCILAGNSARLGGSARLAGLETVITNCTVVANSASESGGAFMASDTQIRIWRSIVSFNEGAALSGSEIDLNCVATNIYGNDGGDWTGYLAPFPMINNNIRSDPLFCETDDFHLQDESPCAADNNPAGLIGALPVGCNNVSLFLQSFTAMQEDDRIELAWSVTPGTHVFRLMGHAGDHPESATWQVPYIADATPGRYTASDLSPAVTAPLRYRLSIQGDNDTWQLLGEIRVDLTGAITAAPLVLDRVYPNPFNPQVTIQYTLGRPADVRASIYDLHGRLIDRFVFADQTAGSHRLVWDGHDHLGRSLPAGTYLLRLDSDGNERTAKLLLVK